MSAVLFKYTCNSCNTKFNAAGAHEMSYGEFVLRSESGEEVFLEAVSSESFNEVSAIVDDYVVNQQIEQKLSENLVQKIFGAVCDYGNSNEPFKIGLMPSCPNCSSRDMSSWSMVNPIELSKIDSAKQTKWSSFNNNQKKEFVSNLIDFFESEFTAFEMLFCFETSLEKDMKPTPKTSKDKNTL